MAKAIRNKKTAAAKEQVQQSQQRQESAPQPVMQVETVNHIKIIYDFMESDTVRQRLESILAHRTPMFIASVMQIISKDKKLQKADLQSIYYSMETAAILNLPLDYSLQRCYISAYEDEVTGLVYCQFSMGWRGLVELCLRSDKFEKINVTDVMEGELVSEDRLTGDCVFSWIADPVVRSMTKIIGYVSYFRLLSGFNKMIFWRTETVVDHAKRYSKSYASIDSGWSRNFTAMAKKTVLKDNLSKWAPLSIDMSRAIKVDQAVITGEGKIQYMDNPEPEFLSDEDKMAAEILKREQQQARAEQQLAQKLKSI